MTQSLLFLSYQFTSYIIPIYAYWGKTVQKNHWVYLTMLKKYVYIKYVTFKVGKI